MTARVLGLDMSLTATGMVLLPSDWDLDWSCVRHDTVRTSKRIGGEVETAVRRQTIAAIAVSLYREWGATLVAIEGGVTRGYNVHTLGQLHGVVKEALRAECIPWMVAEQNTARKLLLGKLPAAKLRKPMTVATVRSLEGCPFGPKDHDLCDAWVAANWALAELGYTAVAA